MSIFITSKQLSFIRRRIAERTLRCSSSIYHLCDFPLFILETNSDEISLLDYKSTIEEAESKILRSLCEPDVFL